MNKNLPLFTKAILLLSIIYIWPSCQKKDNDPPTPVPNTDTTVTPTDTTPLKGWIVSTFAGAASTFGYVDGNATQARFSSPNDITQDITGDLYVMEQINRTIRKVTLAGQVSTLVKEDSSAGVLLRYIGYFLSDGYGRLYYPYNYTHIRTVTANSASIFAGSTTSGYQDGQDISARFNNVMSIARDGKGNLYVADRNAQNQFVLRKITSSGYVSTLTINDQTGISSNSTSSLSYHTLAADSAGIIYFSSGSFNVIKKVDPQGNVTVLAGSTTTGFKDGKGQDAQFNGIVDLDVDHAGNVWVCDVRNNAIRKVAPDGTVTTIAGNGTPGYVNGEGSKARFNMPWGITINKNGTMYMVEANNHAVRKIEYRQ
ncbi:MAG TPA: hypothetical protein VF008_30865 [Niastella sp.]